MDIQEGPWIWMWIIGAMDKRDDGIEGRCMWMWIRGAMDKRDNG